jgi:hypothetical protein
VVHFSTIEYTPAERDLPHSKQHAFNREVINPHDGHILCVPYPDPAICGFSLRILRSSRIVNRTISKPKEILVAFIKTTLLGEFRIERSNDLMFSGHAPSILSAVH